MFGRGPCDPGRKPGMGPPGPPRRGRFEGERGPRFGPMELLKGADLNDDQIQKIAELNGENFLKCGHARLDMMALRKQLLQELSGESVDPAKVKAVAEKIKAQKALLTDLMVDNMLAFANVLTPEQRKRVRINRIRQFFGLMEPEDDEEQ